MIGLQNRASHPCEEARPERSRMGGNLSPGKRGKVFVRLKLGLIGPSTSLRVEQSSSFGLGLGLNWLCFE
jgi:hypothetical protein